MADRWQQYEEQYLLSAAQNTSIAAIAKKLDRSKWAVIARAKMIGLRRINGEWLPRKKPKLKTYVFK